MTKTPTSGPARRTSETHPLQIASLPIRDGYGLIGITLCPGKQQPHASTGSWSRNLGLDLDAIVAWNAAAVVTLVEAHELDRLKVPNLGAAVQDRHLGWYHLPIRDGGIPDAAFEERWAQIGPGLRAMLRDGSSIVLHCMGGLGRAGTIAARLLIELGAGPDAAVSQVRAARPGAIETSAQFAPKPESSAMRDPGLPFEENARAGLAPLTFQRSHCSNSACSAVPGHFLLLRGAFYHTI
jgi:ADP-ribosyl-[dinitrogen reductase] hydrolase